MTEFQGGTLITMEDMGYQYQVHAIRKAIRPLFTDPVTIMCHLLCIFTIFIRKWQIIATGCFF